MNGKYQAYSGYKNSEVEWLDAIPRHWDVKKLKYVSKVQPSNIDKKTKDGEPSVVLCNYTDVYYNDSVDSDMKFMKASATEEQIEKFTLRAGDTIITKDSEDPNDIAIPTFVPGDMPGVVCGYHLSMIRPEKISYGAYIKRVFECGYARAYFATRSNGLTRYGLGSYALENVFYPMPPEEEAVVIANFLDHETAKIDTLIKKQQQLIKLLKEKRQAVISHAVTKGLNPDAPMHDSVVEWLGEVPEHWLLPKISHVCRVLNGSTPDKNNFSYWADGEIPWLASSCLNSDVISVPTSLISNEAFNNSSVELIPAGSLLVGMVGQGKTRGTSAVLSFDSCINQNMAALIPSRKINVKFLFYLFNAMYEDLRELGRGGNQAALNCEIIGSIRIPSPSIDEQNEIVTWLDNLLDKLAQTSDLATNQVEILRERRTALISAAVTGKIDVRNWVAPAHPCAHDISTSMHVTTPEPSNNKTNNKEVAV